MASFLSRQSEQRKGPCQGLELVEKMEPAWTEMPSLGARSTWQTAQTKMPDVDCPVFKLSSFPNLHAGHTKYQILMNHNCFQIISKNKVEIVLE